MWWAQAPKFAEERYKSCGRFQDSETKYHQKDIKFKRLVILTSWFSYIYIYIYAWLYLECPARSWTRSFLRVMTQQKVVHQRFWPQELFRLYFQLSTNNCIDDFRYEVFLTNLHLSEAFIASITPESWSATPAISGIPCWFADHGWDDSCWSLSRSHDQKLAWGYWIFLRNTQGRNVWSAHAPMLACKCDGGGRGSWNCIVSHNEILNRPL